MNRLPVLRTDKLLFRPGFGLFDSFFNDANLPRLFNEKETWVPKIDVSETEKEIVVKAEVPGINKEDIDVTLTDGLLTLRGERKMENEDKKENFHLIERRFGSFSRTLRIPADVDATNIDASYKDGVLTVTVPKPETAQPRKIEIHN